MPEQELSGNPSPKSQDSEKSVGEGVNSKSGRRLVTGNGEYADDITFPGTLHGKFVRSNHGHALITDIDTSHAVEMDGVERVLTAADIDEYVQKFGGVENAPDEEVLASDRVRYDGDEIALVLAEDSKTAVEAVERVEVEYEQLPVVTDHEESLAEDAPVIHPELDNKDDCPVDGNVATTERLLTGDVDEALADADLVIEESFQSNKINPCPLEPHGAVAKYNPGEQHAEIWSSNQAPHTLPKNLSKVLVDFEPRNITAHHPDVGGSFGVKGGHEVFSHEICTVLGAMLTGRPVKIILDRKVSMRVARGRHPEHFDVRLGVNTNGELLAWDIEMTQNTGAVTGYGPSVATSGMVCGSGPYTIPNQRINATIVYTNTMPGSAVRGFGDPQFSFMREQILDMAAEKLDLDPIEIRRKNILDADKLPTRTATGLKWQSGDMPTCLEKTTELINWDEHAGGTTTRDGKLRGVGIAGLMRRSGKLVGGTDYESALVKLSKSGDITVFSGIGSVGQGTETAISQVVADTLGIDVDRVKPVVGDTEKTPEGLGVWADRGAIMGASAATKAAEDLRSKIVRISAHMLDIDKEAVKLSNGRIYNRDNPDNGFSLQEYIDRLFLKDEVVNLPKELQDDISLVGEARFQGEAAEELDEETGTGNVSHTYSFGALAAVVDVDPGTGQIDVVDVAMTEDAGTILNPTLAEGQIQGGIVEGLGEVVHEDYHYGEQGTLQNGNFLDYHLPGINEVPVITKLEKVETPSPVTSHGQKGVGESGIVPVGGAIANAIYDATGVRFKELPLSPDQILPELRDANVMVSSD